MEEEHETSSLRARRKKSSVTLGCCFNGHHRADSLDASSSFSSVPPSPSSSSLRISPTAWIRSKTNDLPDVKIRGRYRGLMSCMRRHRRHSSADFSYDPLSYSLNFEDDDHDSSDVTGDFPMRSFASRLPLSPPRSAAAGDGDQIRMKEQPQMMIRTTPQPPTTRSASTTRAAAVAEVRKSLQQLDVETPAGRTRGSPELPTPFNNIIRKQQHVGEEIRKSRSPDHVGELRRRSLDFPHPPATPKKVILTSTTSTTTSTSTTTPTSRQVLVELF